MFADFHHGWFGVEQFWFKQQQRRCGDQTDSDGLKQEGDEFAK
jgi:hypothetical protein